MTTWSDLRPRIHPPEIRQMDDDDFQLDEHDIQIHCPFCGTEMVHHPNRLFLAEARCGAMIECGNCAEITSWSFTLSPFTLRQVPTEWGGHIECE